MNLNLGSHLTPWQNPGFQPDLPPTCSLRGRTSMDHHMHLPGVSRIRPLLLAPCSKLPSHPDCPPDTKTAFTSTLPVQVRAQAHRPALTRHPPHLGPPALHTLPPPPAQRTSRLLLLCLKSLACFKNQLRDSGATRGAHDTSPDRPALVLLPGTQGQGCRRRRTAWSGREMRGLVPPALHRWGGDYGLRGPQQQTPGASTLQEAAPASHLPSAETTLPRTAEQGQGSSFPRRTSRELRFQTSRQRHPESLPENVSYGPPPPRLPFIYSAAFSRHQTHGNVGWRLKRVLFTDNRNSRTKTAYCLDHYRRSMIKTLHALKEKVKQRKFLKLKISNAT